METNLKDRELLALLPRFTKRSVARAIVGKKKKKKRKGTALFFRLSMSEYRPCCNETSHLRTKLNDVCY